MDGLCHCSPKSEEKRAVYTLNIEHRIHSNYPFVWAPTWECVPKEHLWDCQTGLDSEVVLILGLLCIYHHHYVPSVVNRSAVMDLHRSRSCATVIQSLYDSFVHSLMLSVHIVLGLPRPLLPFILPSISNRCTPSPLIICPKYWHFLFLIVFNNDLLVFILCKTSPLVLCSFNDILNSCIATFQKPLVCRMLL